MPDERCWQLAARAQCASCSRDKRRWPVTPARSNFVEGWRGRRPRWAWIEASGRIAEGQFSMEWRVLFFLLLFCYCCQCLNDVGTAMHHIAVAVWVVRACGDFVAFITRAHLYGHFRHIRFEVMSKRGVYRLTRTLTAHSVVVSSAMANISA